MDYSDNSIAKLEEEQAYLQKMQQQMFENMNIMLENQVNRVENLDIVIQNQSRIIHNQDVIVQNQLNIINNQKKIVDNQVALTVILKTQERMLLLLENLAGNKMDKNQIADFITGIRNEAQHNYEQNVNELEMGLKF